jgi:glycine dehydrogenase
LLLLHRSSLFNLQLPNLMSKTTIYDQFRKRHIGIPEEHLPAMLSAVSLDSLDQLIDETVPDSIRMKNELDLPVYQTEFEYLKELREVAALNRVFKTYIGLGYYSTITPSPILRNIFENPGWYTQYTPYQAEIAQGRLEALLNFQTMVSDLTGLPIANASLLDEGTAAAEAMAMFYAQVVKKHRNKGPKKFFVDQGVYPQTLDVLITRAEPIGVEVVVGSWKTFDFGAEYFGVLLQYPEQDGTVADYRAFAEQCRAKELFITVAADLLSLCVLKAPGAWGADAVVGNTQRFGVPMGYGGPHAAFFATRDEFRRVIPGRIIGVSRDAQGKPALRMALQTREQHIRREKATSNICTAQALLAIMASMYAVYHGPKGLRAIAERVHTFGGILANNLKALGYELASDTFFDTVSVRADETLRERIREVALFNEVNLHYTEAGVQVSLDETVLREDIDLLIWLFAEAKGTEIEPDFSEPETQLIPEAIQRPVDYLTHPVFNSYHTETELMRYIKRLENRDLSLNHSMIALGSCTMKLNAATQLMPVSWAEFGQLHPFVPADQAEGYQVICENLEQYLAEITGFTACSLQPNSGAQGEYAGLMTIRAYHQHRDEAHRNIALIPSSAHGTNPASAVMAGMEVQVVKCDERGNIDVEDLREMAIANRDNLAALMVTYPSTHGVFETAIQEICQIVHDNGGLVYMDGANMNAQVGLTSPGLIGADVCHLNLHKTFAIPHGGGGPGMGPICVNDKLAPFLPGHPLAQVGGDHAIRAVSAAPYGSASILLISYAYIRMLGKRGLTESTKYAILNANYIKARLEGAYEVLYTGEKGRSAHELIIDLRPYKMFVSAEDVAKRLIDYGFHAPTLSFPVAGTIMIEPTESESKAELDRFCDAMLAIHEEIQEIIRGEYDVNNSVLHHAPHTADQATADEWAYPYSRQKAIYPLPYLREGYKFWPSVARIDGAYGDRNLICTCPPIEEYASVSN